MKHAHIAAFVLGGAVLGTGGYLLGRQSTAHGDPAPPAEAATAASKSSSTVQAKPKHVQRIGRCWEKRPALI